MLEGSNQGDNDLEVMGLKHFILPFIILGIGLVLATALWAIERGATHLMIKSR